MVTISTKFYRMELHTICPPPLPQSYFSLYWKIFACHRNLKTPIGYTGAYRYIQIVPKIWEHRLTENS